MLNILFQDLRGYNGTPVYCSGICELLTKNHNKSDASAIITFHKESSSIRGRVDVTAVTGATARPVVEMYIEPNFAKINVTVDRFYDSYGNITSIPEVGTYQFDNTDEVRQWLYETFINRE